MLGEVQVQADSLSPAGFTAPRSHAGFCLCWYLCPMPRVKVGSPRHYQISRSTTMGNHFLGVLRAARMVEGPQQESQYFLSSCRAHGISTTTRFLLKRIPTCLWTTPRSLLVGGATPAAHGGDGFTDECWWVSGDTPGPKAPQAQQGPHPLAQSHST